MTKLYVSRYSNKDLRESEAVKVGISLGAPKFNTGYVLQGTVYALAPSRKIFNLPKEQFIEAYTHQLDVLGVEKIKTILSKFGYGTAKEMVLLCYEDITTEKWCHRSIFADWWYLKTGEKVEEYVDHNTQAEKERKKAEKENNGGQIEGQMSLLDFL